MWYLWTALVILLLFALASLAVKVTLAETDRINVNIREILDVATAERGVVVTLVELKDIQLPESMNRAMARQAEAERETFLARENSAAAAPPPTMPINGRPLAPRAS
ncbi:SPFH domain-containing protein [Micromonospora trifolii]|uniref:SPFH domain-containing protein n=1 Tax=Micromonospora trifolii TaxID=2911208 RepID=UPI003D2F44BE